MDLRIKFIFWVMICFFALNNRAFSYENYLFGPCTQECLEVTTSEEHAQLHEERKKEFEERLQLTNEQKFEIEKLKQKEIKKLKSCRKKMTKINDELIRLINYEKLVRSESIRKFDALMTQQQREEMEVINEEMKMEVEQFIPTCNNPNCPCSCHKSAVEND